jgi:beta-glucosidase
MGKRAAAAGVAVDYAAGCVNASCLEHSGFAAAAAAAKTADAVVVVLGMGQTAFGCHHDVDKTACEAEAYDRPTCSLPGGQPALVAAIRAAATPGMPVIGVLIHGGALCIDPATLDALDAVLDGWYPGMRGGAALADALIGTYSPSGRSGVTFYASDLTRRFLQTEVGEMSPYPKP